MSTRTKSPVVAALLAGTTLLSASTALAQAQPTTKDRLDTVISTVTGSAMADLDVDMKHVLDATKNLGGKLIEGLAAVEARKQPSPTDGVTALLKEQG